METLIQIMAEQAWETNLSNRIQAILSVQKLCDPVFPPHP